MNTPHPQNDNQPRNEYHPYIPADQSPREFTLIAIWIGSLLSIVFGAANAYLGLRVGMTISASIPAAVLSMVILRVLLRRNSILENNMVQTIASAGESMAAGVIFTIPAFFLWEQEKIMPVPRFSTITLLALFGGILGVLFMIPLRKHLVQEEDRKLLYPEGRACSNVLLSAESQEKGGKYIFYGIGAGALIKMLYDGLHIGTAVITLPIKKLFTHLKIEGYPALLGVGYICGFRVSATLFAGGLLSWLVLIPLIVFFGGDNIIHPAETTVRALYQQGGADAIWGNYIRYIGAGAVAAGGIFGVIKSLPVIAVSFFNLASGFRKNKKTEKRTERDLDFRLLTAGIVLILVLIAVLPQIPLNLLGVLLFAICGFCFALVAARIAGMVGSSNSPCSGMTIAVLLICTSILKRAGVTGTTGMTIALSIAAMCCIITAIAGDTAQDLKTGFLLGATPWKQQVGEIIGVLFSALCIGGTLLLLHKAWGFGSPQLPAPQAHLMKLVTEGVMQGSISWPLVLSGAAIAIVAECLGIPSLCLAIGIFLPFSLTTTIFAGGIARAIVTARKNNEENGILCSSGLIAGEGLAGILLALLTVLKLDGKINLQKFLDLNVLPGVIITAATIFFLVWICRGTKPAEKFPEEKH